MTKHKKEGIFPMSEKMPCQPRHIVIKDPYMLPVVFDNNLEAEEATARIISFSQQAKEWVGVSWQRLLSIMKTDKEAHKRHREQERQELRRSLTERKKRWYHSLGAPFCWLYRRPFQSRREKKLALPLSGTYAYGFSFVRRGLRFLISGGWLRAERHGGNTVYFPTPKLIKRIMRKYDIIAK